MRRSIRQAQLVALVAVGLCVFVTPATGQEFPYLVGSVPGDAGRAVGVSGDYAYVGRSPWPPPDGGIYVVDVSIPSMPFITGSLVASWSALEIAVTGDYAYVAAGSDGLRVIDVSDPSTPVEVGGGAGGNPLEIRDVVVSGNFAYVADANFGLRVIDVSDPLAPVEVGSLPVPGAHALDVSGTYAFVTFAADADGGLVVIDVSAPSAPAEVATLIIDLLAGPDDIAVSGDYAYLAYHYPLISHSHVSVIDVSSPTSPQLVGLLGEWDWTSPLRVSRDVAYIRWGVYDGGGSVITAIDVSTPSSPFEIGSTDWGSFGGFAISNGFLYASDGSVPPDGDGGLDIYLDCAVSVFSDGFESGDTSAWSVTVP